MKTKPLLIRVHFNFAAKENGITRFYFERFPSVGDHVSTENGRYVVSGIDHIVSTSSDGKEETLLLLDQAD